MPILNFNYAQTMQIVSELPIIRSVIAWSRRTSLPGCQGVPIYDIAAFLRSELANPNINSRANATAFSFFLSLFPALMVIFSLIPYLPINKGVFLKQLSTEIRTILPDATGDTILSTIRAFIYHKRGDVLSVGFLLAMYFSSNGILALMSNFEKKHAVFIRLPFYEKRLRAIGMVFLLGLMMTASIVLVISTNQWLPMLTKLFKLTKYTERVLVWLNWLIIIALIYLGTATIYRFGVSMRSKVSFFSPGATIAALASLITSLGFAFYVDNFGKYNSLYGSIGSIIVLMIWMQMNALVLIFGFELNAAVAVNRDLLDLAAQNRAEAAEIPAEFVPNR
jgi:membrane protein